MEDMKQAMRDRNADRLGTIRFLLAEIKNEEIDHGELDDAGVQRVIARQVKQITEAMAEFDKGGRPELVEAEKAKVAVLQAYLPEPMSEAELAALVDKVIASQTNPQMGQVMQAVRAEAGSRADGAKIAELVRQRLS